MRHLITPAAPRPIARFALALLSLTLLLGAAATVAAQVPIVSTRVGEVPTTGGMRPGPVGLVPPPASRPRGALPVAIQVEKALVDAEIETVQIEDGVMQNPTGPWVVSWYQETARLGEPGNAVMAGHVDYWNVGPAVFYNLGDLVAGDEIQITGEDEEIYTYQVEWLETVQVADLTTERIQELIGQTEAESLTLITCGGEFDYENGEYLSRMVVRAVRV
ncbi:MAG: class F sortase [Chloroflexia bacterium]|jgi:LPXTG-site transpeptidase (sortase) family protein|nr:class F sortase [Chloroflexia bacterium]